MPETIQAFIETAAEQIRWKKARGPLLEELSAHLMDQRDACVAEGLTPEAAEREALRQMGDPVAIGAELDRVHRPRPQWGLLLFALILLAVCGMLRNLLTVPLRLDGHKFYDLMSIVLGAVCLLSGYLLDVSFLGKAVRLLFPAFFAAILALISVGPSISGKAWLAERAMLLFPVLLAALLWSQKGRGWRGAAISLAGAGLGLLTASVLPSVFSVLLVALSALTLGLLFTWQDWFGIGKRRGVILTILLAAAVLAGLLWLGWGRLQSNLFPARDPLGEGYFAVQIRRALSCARWAGHADVAGWEAETGLSFYQLVPELGGVCLLVHLICKFGWLPFLLLMAAFGGFFSWAMWKALRLRQALGQAVSLAALTTLLAQAGMGLLITFGVPMASASFPLMVGNWASVFNALLIGLALSSFRDGALPESRKLPAKQPRYKLTVKLEKV